MTRKEFEELFSKHLDFNFFFIVEVVDKSINEISKITLIDVVDAVDVYIEKSVSMKLRRLKYKGSSVSLSIKLSPVGSVVASENIFVTLISSNIK